LGMWQRLLATMDSAADGNYRLRRVHIVIVIRGYDVIRTGYRGAVKSPVLSTDPPELSTRDQSTVPPLALSL
jgi:hypothetical protein